MNLAVIGFGLGQLACIATGFYDRLPLVNAAVAIGAMMAMSALAEYKRRKQLDALLGLAKQAVAYRGRVTSSTYEVEPYAVKTSTTYATRYGKAKDA